MKQLKKVINNTFKYVPLFLMIGFIYTDFAFAEDKKLKSAWKDLMTEYHIIVAGFIGIGVVSSLLIFIIHMMKLASVGSNNPTERSKILKNVFISGICTGLLGGVGLIFSILIQTVY